MKLEENSRFRIFTGNANPKLAQAIADHLGTTLGEAFVGHFNNGETQVMLDESVRGKDIFIVQPTSAPVNDSLMELLIMVDACKRSSARTITAVVPYYAYARQDRKTRGREPISAKLVANLLTVAGVNRVVTMDLHAGQIQGIIEKRRPKPGIAEVMNLIGDVNGKTAVIVDDIVDTAGSLVEGAKALEKFGAKAVYACCTHGVLSDPAVERISNSNMQELIITDTIPMRDGKECDKIKVVSVAQAFGDIMLSIYKEEPVSKLFDK